MRRPLPLAASLCLVLAACGTEPTAPPPDAPTPDVGGDTAVEVGADAAPDAPEDRPEEAGPDAAPDVAAEAGVDASQEAAVDVPAPDAAEDRPSEAGPDAPPDAAADGPPPCVEGAMRCGSIPGPGVEYCVGGAWVPSECDPISLPGATSACMGDACYLCRRADGGVGCAAEPLCAGDVDCYRLGQGRCVTGRCARRGALRCTGNTDCGPWSTPSTFASCVENRSLGAVPVMTCGGDAQRCTHEAMCPAAFRCDASGFCVAR